MGGATRRRPAESGFDIVSARTPAVTRAYFASKDLPRNWLLTSSSYFGTLREGVVEPFAAIRRPDSAVCKPKASQRQKGPRVKRNALHVPKLNKIGPAVRIIK